MSLMMPSIAQFINNATFRKELFVCWRGSAARIWPLANFHCREIIERSYRCSPEFRIRSSDTIRSSAETPFSRAASAKPMIEVSGVRIS